MQIAFYAPLKSPRHPVPSGDRRVDEKKVDALVGRTGRADADFVKAKTGFSIGGVSPLAHAGPVLTLIDRIEAGDMRVGELIDGFIDPDAPEEEAAEFLKQWQAQMTRQMHDPDMIRAMLAAMQPFGAAAHDETSRQSSPAPDAGDDAIARLERRVGQLERLVSELAGRDVSVAAKAKKSAGAAKRVRTKPVAKPKRGVAKKRT